MSVHFTHHVMLFFQEQKEYHMHLGGNWWCVSTTISGRLYNSQALLEGTNLMLYNINEGVLVITDVLSMCEAYLTVFCIR